MLPYLNEVKLYNALTTSASPDSELNRKLLDSMPDVYHDPVYGEDNGKFTNYAMLIGDWKGPLRGSKTAFQPSGQRFAVVDGRMNSFTVGATSPVDSPTAPPTPAPSCPSLPTYIPWTKPDDLVIDEKLPALGRPGGIAAPYAIDKMAAPALCRRQYPRVLDTIRPTSS